MPLGASFFEDVPLVEFMYLAFTQMPGGVTAGDTGLCSCGQTTGNTFRVSL